MIVMNLNLQNGNNMNDLNNRILKLEKDIEFLKEEIRNLRNQQHPRREVEVPRPFPRYRRIV